MDQNLFQKLIADVELQHHIDSIVEKIKSMQKYITGISPPDSNLQKAFSS